MKNSKLISRLTGKAMPDGQHEFTSRSRVFTVGEEYTVQSGNSYRVIAVSAVHPKYGQIILAEEVGVYRWFHRAAPHKFGLYRAHVQLLRDGKYRSTPYSHFFDTAEERAAFIASVPAAEYAKGRRDATYSVYNGKAS